MDSSARWAVPEGIIPAPKAGASTENQKGIEVF
jgi:hypothetical protein